MPSFTKAAFVAALAATASAFQQPDYTKGDYAALRKPDTATPVTQGQTYTVTWDTTNAAATPGQLVTLALCRGNGPSCTLASTAIVEHVPASAGTYSWAVPCSLPVGTANTDTGNGMLIIVEGTGQFQYSMQFSVLAGSSCSSSSSSSSSSSVSTTSGSSSSSTTSAGSGGNPWEGWSSSTTATPKVTTTSYVAVTTPPAGNGTTTTLRTSSVVYVPPTSASSAAASATSSYTGAAEKVGASALGLGLAAMAIMIGM